MRRNPEVCEMPVPCCRECELDSSFHPKVWLTKFSLSKCLNLCLSLLIDEVLQSTLETFGSTYHNYTDLLTKANERDLWKFLSSQTRASTWPRHSFPYKLGEASQAIWGQINQHGSRGNAALLLMMSPVNGLCRVFGSLTLHSSPSSKHVLLVCFCVLLKAEFPPNLWKWSTINSI